MKTPTTMNILPLRAIFWVGIVISALLIGSYLKAASHLRNLTTTLAELKAESVKSEPQMTALRQEIEAAAENISAMTGGQSGPADEVRRKANLAAIARLKALHEANPPPPPPLMPPPRMPAGIAIPGGIVFPELINDPEYRAAYLNHLRARLRKNQLPELLRLGLSKEISEKVIAVLAEDNIAAYDYRQLADNPMRGVPREIMKSIAEDTRNQLRQLMGAETYSRYRALDLPAEVTTLGPEYAVSRNGQPTHEALVVRSSKQFIPLLTNRLSYSDSPLQSAQADELAELLATNCATPGVSIYRVMYTDAFIDQAAKVLTAPQLAALRQLQTENQALTIRSQLPKSSELPRNAPVAK